MYSQIGHALGLEHSNDSYSLVHPYVYVDSVLKEDDIQLIRHLYHCKLNTDFTTRTTLRPPLTPQKKWVTEPSEPDLQLMLNDKTNPDGEISQITKLTTQDVNNF